MRGSSLTRRVSIAGLIPASLKNVSLVAKARYECSLLPKKSTVTLIESMCRLSGSSIENRSYVGSVFNRIIAHTSTSFCHFFHRLFSS